MYAKAFSFEQRNVPRGEEFQNVIRWHQQNASFLFSHQETNSTANFPPFLARDDGCYCRQCPPDDSSPVSSSSASFDEGENKENFGLDSPPKKKPNPLSKEKRERYLSWDDYFMTVAFLSSQRSKDPNKQVGAVIASESKLILGRFFLILSFVRCCLRRLARSSLSLREVALTFFCDYINRCGIQRFSARVRRRRLTVGQEKSHGRSSRNQIRVRVPRGDERHHEQKFRGREERNHVRDHVSVQRVREVDDSSRD